MLAYTCQLSRIMHESHTCESKIVISRIQTNFSRLTDKLVSVIAQKLIVQFQKISILPPQMVVGWNFLGSGGFCKAKKFKEMYEA